MAFPDIVPSSVLGAGRPTPGGRITLGIIGTGNQGTNDLKNHLNDDRVQVVAICDVNRESAGYWNGGIAGRDPAKKIVEQFYGSKATSGTYKGCDTYEDFRVLLGRKDIDAVHIAVPDHWHCIPVLMAAKAKKDIYAQKPLALTIAEGRAMADAVKKHKVIFQCGSQQRSDRNFRHACELVRNGRIGKLHTVKVGQPAGWPDYGKTADRKKPQPVPQGFDYEMWLGPAPSAPYAPARVGVNFRWISDYSGGQVTDWGGHHPDIAQWAMGTDDSGPVAIKNAKGVYPADELYNTATEYYFECIYASGVKLIVSDKNKMGVTFEGTEGSVYVTRGSGMANPEALWEAKLGEKDVQLYTSSDHYRNWVDCILSGKPTIAPCETAHRSITIAHLGNIAMKLGRDLQWDPKKERFVNDAGADKMLTRPYREPWTIKV